MMNYRHEWKHEINYADRLVLLSRLGTVMKRDEHAIGGVNSAALVSFNGEYMG